MFKPLIGIPGEAARVQGEYTTIGNTVTIPPILFKPFSFKRLSTSHCVLNY